jgi:hypothetical protein
MTTVAQPATKKPNVTQQLDALFDQVGPDALCLSFAQALAEAHGLNKTVCAALPRPDCATAMFLLSRR